MKIVVAASVLQGREAFSTLGRVTVLPDREIRREDLHDADALIVRSQTRVTAELLAGTPVSFVATATAGADHFDTEWLTDNGIAWTAAPGCNANAVAEYIITALALLARQRSTELPGKTIGIVGVGQIGSRVAQKATALGLRVLRNDPPLALQTQSPEYLPLEAILPEADILTLHVPLTTTGPFPTHHLADCRLFGQLKPGAWFLNAARGNVTDSEALEYALANQRLSASVLDVWANEPQLPPALQQAVNYLTPHIAGYTLEGLLNGTLHCARELAHFLEVEPAWTPDLTQLPPAPTIALDAAGRHDEEVLAELLITGCPIPADDRAWRAEMAAASDAADLRRRFDTFRKNYTSRREFAAIRAHLANATPALLEAAAALGFQISAPQ